jgi:hypothetical protein
MGKQFITEAARFQKLAGITAKSKTLDEAKFTPEPNSEDYFTTRKEVTDYLRLALKKIEDFEDRTAPPGSANLNPDDPNADYYFSSPLLSNVVDGLEELIYILEGPPEEKFDFDN